MNRTPLEAWISEKTGNLSGPLTREKIERHQLEKLRETLAWAGQKSPFYRKRLAGGSAAGLSGLGDLAGFPFTTAKDIGQNPLRFLCVSQSAVRRVVTLRTSGTTGEPKRIFFTGDDQELTIDFFHRGMSTLAAPGETVLILLPGELPGSVGDLLVRGLRRLGARGIVYGPVRDYRHALEVMAGEKADVLVGIPVQALSLARRGKGEVLPKSVLLSTDSVPDALRRELRRIWGCEVYAHYGMTEMGFGGGVECEARWGYHMREADLYFEIVDPRTGDPLKDGETGEVVFTTLTRRGMPLIRYRTGDLGRFLPGPCPCGTVLKTMARLGGRLRGRIELGPGAALTMQDLDEALFAVGGLVDFSAQITRENGVDRLRITAAMLEEGENAGSAAEIVRGAVSAIPAVRSALRGGKLAVEAVAREGGPRFSTGGAKRTIIDKRR